VIIDDKEEKTIKPLFDASKIHMYIYDPLEGIKEGEFEPYFDTNGLEKDVCFSYRFFRNGVGEQVLVQSGKWVYDLGDYLKTEAFESLEELRTHKEMLQERALR
jgi:hypothetical protein